MIILRITLLYSGAISDGFTSAQFPAAIASARGIRQVTVGKFHVPITKATPSGSWTMYELAGPTIIGVSTFSKTHDFRCLMIWSTPLIIILESNHLVWKCERPMSFCAATMNSY